MSRRQINVCINVWCIFVFTDESVVAGAEASILEAGVVPTTSTPFKTSRAVVPGPCSPSPFLAPGSHPQSGLLCDTCGKIFHSSSGLTDHKRMQHGTPRHRCTQAGCGQGFMSHTALESHLSRHAQVIIHIPLLFQMLKS